MEDEQKNIKVSFSVNMEDAFVQLHAPKAQLHKERCVFLTQYMTSGISIDTVLERYTLDQITRMFEINQHKMVD